MKALIFSLIALACAIIYFRSTRFDFLDFSNTNFDITWDDITEDLWS